MTVRSKLGFIRETAAALRTAQTPDAVGAALRQARKAGLSDRALRAAGAPARPPGYQFNPNTRRWMSVKDSAPRAVGHLASAATFPGMAAAAYSLAREAHPTRVNRAHDEWRIAGNAGIRGSKTAMLVNAAGAPLQTASDIRRMLGLKTTAVHAVNASGRWDVPMDQNKLAVETAITLGRPFVAQGQGANKEAIDAAPYWDQEVFGPVEDQEVPLVCYRQPIARLTHPAVEVHRHNGRGEIVEFGRARRSFDVHVDNVFALEPGVAAELVADRAELEAYWQAQIADAILPVASFLMVGQTVEITPCR